MCSFLNKISNWVGQITKSGYYWFNLSFNVADINLNPEFMISNSPTSGYSSLIQSSSENGSAPATGSLNQIIYINAGSYLMIRANNSTATSQINRVCCYIEWLPSSINVVN